MSVSHPYEVKLNTVSKPHIGTIILDWELDSIATCSAVLRDTEEIDAFIEVDFERDGGNVFNGRIENSIARFSQSGSPMPISGFDWTVILKDYPTASQSIVDSTVAAALTAILSEITDITLTEVVPDIYELVTPLQDWDTSHEFLTTITTYTNCSIEYALTDIEIQSEFADGRTIADFGLSGNNNCFLYDGATERYYIWTREGNDIIYYHSTDGVAWTRVDSGFNSTNVAWSVMWRGAKVYLFVYDGVNTDFYRGTIADATGTVTLALIAGNIFAGTLRFGPVYDNNSHLWVVAAITSGRAYESTDDGVTWNLRFSGPAGGHALWGVMPEGNDGDMVSMVVDVANDDLEEWFWDRSAGTHTFVGKITDTANDIDSLDAALNGLWATCIAWTDGGSFSHAYRVASGNWVVSSPTGNPNNTYITVSSDGGECSYVYVNTTGGFRAYKFRNGVLVETFSDNTLPWNTSGLLVGGTRCWGNDGFVGAGIGCGTDAANDGWFFLFNPTGIRLNRNQTSGDFNTDIVTASGNMTAWGTLNADGVAISTSDVNWFILKAGDSSRLAGPEIAPFDLDIAGVDPAETSIIINCELTNDFDDPYVYAFYISEKTDNVSLDTDFEDAYTAVRKLADLVGAEFFVTKDNGTYTITLTLLRGSDKSDSVILKTAKTSDYPDVLPNIKVISKTFDWSSYANIVQVIGGEDTDGNRVIAVIRDNEEILAKGKEYWFTIRDADITVDVMADQRASIELDKRNAVTLRIGGEFLDPYDTGQIEIGDRVTLVAEWPEESLKISGPHRVVNLHREFGVSGETVTATFTTKLKQAEFYKYLRLTDDQSRWITA